MRGEERQRGVGGAAGVRGLFRPGPYRRLLVAQGISGLGDWVATFAFIALAYSLTHNQTAVGAVLVLRLVPPMFAAPVGGFFADRADRRRLMVACDLARGALIVVAPFAPIAGVYVVAFAHECLSLLYLPSRDAMVPSLVDREDLPLANGLVLGSTMGSIPFAAALFGGLQLAAERTPGWVPFDRAIAGHPTTFAFWFDALTFAASAALVAGLPAATGGGRDADGEGAGVFAGVAEGFRTAWRTPVLRSLGAGLVVAMLGGGVLFAVGIAYVRETLGGGDAEFGWLASLWGAGMGIGVGLVRLLLRERGERVVFVAAVALCGGVLVTMALAPWLWLAFGAAVVFGAAFSVAIMVALSMAQAAAEDRVRGRIMAGVQMLFRIGLGVGALGIGSVATTIDRVTPGVGGLRIALDGNQAGLLLGGGLILAGAAASSGLLRHHPK